MGIGISPKKRMHSEGSKQRLFPHFATTLMEMPGGLRLISGY